MFEFCFPHIMESSADGSWWPTIIGSLLGALFSGLIAIWIFRRGYENETKRKETELLKKLNLFETLFADVVRDKFDTYKFNQSLIESYTDNPFGYHPHKIEMLGKLKRLDKLNANEILEGCELRWGKGDASLNIFRQAYQFLDYFLEHSRVYVENVLALKEDWYNLSLEIKRETTSTRLLVANLIASLRHIDPSYSNQKLEEILNKTLGTYLYKLKSDPDQTLDFHKTNFLDPLIQSVTDEKIAKYDRFKEISDKAKTTQLLFFDLEKKSQEIVGFVKQIDSELLEACKSAEQFIKANFKKDFKLEVEPKPQSSN